jgi:hypothetical protein
MARSRTPWWHRIRELHRWALEQVDWSAHIDRLNGQYGLSGETALSPPLAGWPPAWFTGDIECLEPNAWILVVSLNPALAEPGHYKDRDPLSDSWRFWCEHNLHREHWNKASRFFPRLVELASLALGESVAESEQGLFATERMLFLEFSPYASKGFLKMRWEKIQEIADGDPGFAINRQIRSIVFNHGQPKLILVNGGAAYRDVNDYQRPGWNEAEIRLAEGSNKAMRLWRGIVRPWQQEIPILGFDFLGRQQHPSRLSETEEMSVLKSEIAEALAHR